MSVTVIKKQLLDFIVHDLYKDPVLVHLDIHYLELNGIYPATPIFQMLLDVITSCDDIMTHQDKAVLLLSIRHPIQL